MGSDETKMREFASDCNTTIQKQKHTHFGFLFSVPAPKKTSSSCTRTHISNPETNPRQQPGRKQKERKKIRVRTWCRLLVSTHSPAVSVLGSAPEWGAAGVTHPAHQCPQGSASGQRLAVPVVPSSTAPLLRLFL